MHEEKETKDKANVMSHKCCGEMADIKLGPDYDIMPTNTVSILKKKSKLLSMGQTGQYREVAVYYPYLRST